MKIIESAPSNIALIKYMGKHLDKGNFPTNSSFSWTLQNLRTYVEVEKNSSTQDIWEPLVNKGLYPIDLNKKSVERFLGHLQLLKTKMGFSDGLILRSANNFPSDCGLASSASSFAALTLAVAKFAEVKYLKKYKIEELAELSRQGSGSSCRSFYGPWCIWSSEGVYPKQTPYNRLEHMVLLIEEGKKDVSSSEAHKRVLSSSLFPGRPERAEARLNQLLSAFQNQDWSQAYEICWAEFWDMHALFETSSPHFSYMSSKTLEALRLLEVFWKKNGRGPLVTMDAGANVHLLWKEEDHNLWPDFESQFKNFKIFKGSSLFDE